MATKKKSNKKCNLSDIRKGDIIFIRQFKMFDHSLLSNSNKTFVVNNTKLKQFMECNIKKNNIYGCFKSLIPICNNASFTIITPDYSEIKKLIPNLNKNKLVNYVVKEMTYFVNDPKIKTMNSGALLRIFKKCQIPKSKLLTHKVSFSKKKMLVCHEAVILAWRRGLYKYIKTFYKDEKIILEKVNKIIPLNSKKCILNFSKYLEKTPYWNKLK